ncbi:hypothetical protein BJ170DRAFT_637365 [Xylariales sp. AK1849]|nr:hypothetical protein BJ170DRAFT_637365 [Xylariales sp. AK1849]
MPDGKKKRAGRGAKADQYEAPPPYEATSSHAGRPAEPEPGADPSQAIEGTTQTQSVTVKGPTVESPFDFPADFPAPSYAESSSSVQRPIAIPQVAPDAAAPFVSAYAPSLLSYGITPQSWRSFIDTLSAFLTAKVSDQAISRAADIAKHVGNVPKRFGKDVGNHATSIGKNISGNAKRGNFLGAAMGVVSGAVTLPISTAIGVVGAVVSLPRSAASAAAQKPQTPRERAVVYTTTANKNWFHARGLHAQLLDTEELSRLLNITTTTLLDSVQSSKEASATTQLDTLGSHIAELEILLPTRLNLGEQTIWLVITSGNGRVE